MPGYGQSLGAALGQFAFGGGDPERSKAGMKGMLDGAHAGAYDANRQQSLAQALKAQADAANTSAQTGILNNRGANVDLTMAAESGVPLPQINAFRDYLKTGVKPMSSATGDMQTDEAIGIAPSPTFDNGVMAKLAPLMKRNLPYLTNTGDIKIDDAAQADATYNTTGLINRVAGGGKQYDAIRALLAAKGKGEFDNLGGNGVFSGVDGGQQLNAVGTSAAGENVARAGAAKAQAANSYASAGQHNASTDKIREEIKQVGVSARTEGSTKGAPTGYRWKADGSQEPIPGGPAANKSDQSTEGERKAATLLKRLEGSQMQLNAALTEKPSAAKPGLGSSAMRAVGSEVLANGITSSERQRVEAAQLDILDAALTLGTGAAYTKEQLEGYRKSYFPQINDTADNVRDKKARLANVIDAAKIAAGRSAPKAEMPGYGDSQKQPAPAGMPAGFKVIR